MASFTYKVKDQTQPRYKESPLIHESYSIYTAIQ